MGEVTTYLVCRMESEPIDPKALFASVPLPPKPEPPLVGPAALEYAQKTMQEAIEGLIVELTAVVAEGRATLDAIEGDLGLGRN